MYVQDLQGNQFVAMASTTIDDTLNGDITVSMTLYPNKANNQFLQDIDSLWTVFMDDGTEFKIRHTKKQGRGAQMYKEVKGVPTLFDKLQNTREYERFDGSFSIENLLNLAFRNTGFSYTLIGSWNNIEIEGYGDGENKLEMFQRVLNRIGAEFTFSGTVVTIRQQIGNDTQHMYRHHLNASNIVHEVDAESYWTYARGFGDYDETTPEDAALQREYTSPLASLLGVREAPPIKDGRMTIASTMDAALKKLVDESIKVSVTADLADLRNRNYPYAQSRLGDRVFLIDERIGLSEEVRIVGRSITRNWLGKITALNFTFGTQSLTKRYTAKINNVSKTMQEILDGRQKLPFATMADEIQILTRLMQNVQTQLTVAEDGSLHAIDKNDPNLVVIYNAAGLFVSEDGGATPKAAITGRGIMGDTIIANTILADALAANTIVVGFNENSTNIKLYNNRLEFNDNGVITGRLTARGQEYWYGDRSLGWTGEGQAAGRPNIRGIGHRLEYEGDYINFAYRANPDDANYTNMLTLDPFGRYFPGNPGIYMNGTLRLQGHDVRGMERIYPGGGEASLRFGRMNIGGVGNSFPGLFSENYSSGIVFASNRCYLVDNGTAYLVSDLA